jgi:hypothetical protein
MIPLPPTWPIFWLLPGLGFGEGFRVYRRPEAAPQLVEEIVPETGSSNED